MNNDEWAEALYQARIHGEPKPVNPGAREQLNDLEAALANAYSVQKKMVALLASNADIIGFKGALTNKLAQQSLGIDRPVTGVLLSDMALSDNAAINLSGFGRAMLETEIGFCIGTEIRDSISSEALPGYIDHYLPMIEIADIGFAAPKAMTVLDLVAGDSAAAGFIKGQKATLRGESINAINVSFYHEDVLLHQGVAHEVMGDQFAAATWLINQIIAQGYVISPGQIIMTGAIGGVQVAAPGAYRADFGRFGEIQFSIAA